MTVQITYKVGQTVKHARIGNALHTNEALLFFNWTYRHEKPEFIRAAQVEAIDIDHFVRGKRHRHIDLSEFKHELRMHDIKYDPWGTAMSFWFQLCDYLHFLRRTDVPDEWQYRPSPLGCDIDENDMEQYLNWEEYTTAQLIDMGNFLCRYTNFLKRAGKDY